MQEPVSTCKHTTNEWSMGGAWSPVQNSLALSTWQDPWASKGKGKETSKGIRAALAIELSLILLLLLASHGTEAIHVTIYSKNPQDVGRSKLCNRQKGPQSSKTSWDWCKLLQKLVRSHHASGKILVKGTPQKGLGKGWAKSLHTSVDMCRWLAHSPACKLHPHSAGECWMPAKLKI